MNTIARKIALGISILAILGIGAISDMRAPRALAADQAVDGTSMVLHGTINPNGRLTTAWFEYGTDSALTIYKESPHTVVGSQKTNQNFAIELTGLHQGTAYYFRLVADNGLDTSKGNVLSFQTPAGPAPAPAKTPAKSDNSNLAAASFLSSVFVPPTVLVALIIVFIVVLAILVVMGKRLVANIRKAETDQF